MRSAISGNRAMRAASRIETVASRWRCGTSGQRLRQDAVPILFAVRLFVD